MDSGWILADTGPQVAQESLRRNQFRFDLLGDVVGDIPCRVPLDKREGVVGTWVLRLLCRLLQRELQLLVSAS